MEKKQFIAIGIILLFTGLLFGTVQYFYHTSRPENWSVTTKRAGEMYFGMPRADVQKVILKKHELSRPVKAGETFRVLGHNAHELWVEAENGERGMISQALVADTVITVKSTEDYPEGRRMTIENVDPESGDLTLRDFYGATHKNVNNNWVQTMDIFRNSSLKVRKKGYGWIRNEQFEEQVLGESLAHLDTAFAPVLYRYADKAILSRRVYDNEDNALYLPVLRVDAQGIVKGITTYSDPVEEFSNSRAYLLKLPGASYLLDHCEFIMDAGVYEQDNSGSDIRRRMRWHRNPEIKARSGARKFFGVIGESILALIFLIPFGVLWGWYYCVTFCLIPCILIQVARSPKPFERLSNEQLDKFFKWLSYPHLYLVLLLGAVNLDVNLFWGLVGMIGACSCIFGFARLLVSKRCPDCKHTFCHELADTEWGEPYYTKEEVTESHREGSKQTGSTKECTEVSGLGPAGANVAEVDVTVTEHYDVTIRHDVYEVTYEHQDGIEYHKCRYCGHVKTEKTNRFKLYSREYVRSYYTHQKEDKTHREEDRMR